MTDDQALRDGLEKQALFRTVNDGIEEINEAFRFFTDRYVLLCECGRSRCVERVAIAPGEYRQLRRNDRLFVVAPGHEQPELERVVAECPGYRVVALRPRARRILGTGRA